MRQKGLFFLVFALGFSTSIWSDEPARSQAPLKQRVDPKLLREALALPEYRGQAPEAPPVSLDDLLSLSDKLKKNGDAKDAELLQRFIREHQRIVKHAFRSTVATEDEVEIRYQFIDVSLDELPHNSVLRANDSRAKSEEIHMELKHLVSTRKAKVLSEPILRTKVNETARLSEGEQFPVPVPAAAGKASIEFREFGTIIEVLPTVAANDKIRLQSTLEISQQDWKNAVTLLGTKVPGITTQKIRNTIDVNIGEATIWSGEAAIPSHPEATRHKIFVIVTVTRPS